MPSKLLSVVREETAAFHPRWQLVRWALAPLPPFAGGRVRAAGLRLAGFRVGRGSLFFGTPHILGSGDIYRRLVIGHHSMFSIGCLFDLSAEISIGGVGMGLSARGRGDKSSTAPIACLDCLQEPPREYLGGKQYPPQRWRPSRCRRPGSMFQPPPIGRSAVQNELKS